MVLRYVDTFTQLSTLCNTIRSAVTRIRPVRAAAPSAPSYTYAYDSTDRLNTMTDSLANTIGSGTTYNAAEQMITMGTVAPELRTYNPMGHLTNIAIYNSLNITFPGSAGYYG